MITMVIYGLIAIALAASAGYAFITFSSSSRQLTQLQENQVRMETATAALRASLLALTADGVLYPPAGATAGNVQYTTLPTTLGVVGAAPWGQPYEYCPLAQVSAFGPGATGTQNITDVGGNPTYQVGTYVGPLTQGNTYVVTTPQGAGAPIANSAGYVAFVVSTLGPGQQMPTCAQIVVGAGGITVPSGSVRGVTAGFTFMQRVVASTDRMEIYASPNGAPTGNSTGVDANNEMGIDNALSLWAGLQPRLTVIYLDQGVVYTSTNSTLNAELNRYAAMGEDSSLVIETNPAQVGNAQDTFYSNKATINFNLPLTLKTRTTFQNVNVNVGAGGNASIDAYAPVIFRNSFLNDAGPVLQFNIHNTNALFYDVGMSDDNVNAMGSTVQFIREIGAAVGIDSLQASSSHISFNNLNANAANGNAWQMNGAVPGNTYGIVLSNSDMTVGDNQFNSYVVNYGHAAYLSNSRLTVNSNGATSGGFLGSYLGTDQENPNNGGAVSAYDGSSVVVLGTLGERTLGGGHGTILVGSSLAVNGILAYQDTGISLGAIAASEGTVTGSGVIHVPSTNQSCIDIIQSNGTVRYPIVLPPFVPVGTNGYANFNDVKMGLPPLFTYTTTTNATLSPADTNTIAQLVQSQAAQTWPNQIDPYVSVPAAPTQTAANYALDPTTFEAAVRGIVNKEFVKGLNISFNGTCVSP